VTEGWYVPNNVNVGLIIPEYRSVGGGITSESLFPTREKALIHAMALTSARKQKCEHHLRWLQREWNKK